MLGEDRWEDGVKEVDGRWLDEERSLCHRTARRKLCEHFFGQFSDKVGKASDRSGGAVEVLGKEGRSDGRN